MNQQMKLEKANIEDILPLTPMQESMLFQYLNNPGTEQYFEQLCLELEGNIQSDVFKNVWQFVAKNNETLRMVYRWEKLEQPVQVILKEIEIPISEYDFAGLEEAEQQQKLAEIKEKDRKEKIDISAAPFRITLCKFGEKAWVMILSNHHILYDGWSNGVILKEFMEVYRSLAAGEEPVQSQKSRFKDFIKWQREQDREKQKTYWEEALRGFNDRTSLPYDRKVKAEDFSSEELAFTINDVLAGLLSEYAKKHNTSLATLFYTAWSVLLRRYSNSRDVVFGTTVSGRTHRLKGINDTVGLFINTVPLRINVSSDDTVQSLMEDINRTLDGREDYECTSLSDIRSYSEVGGSGNLFDSIVVVENYPLSHGGRDGDPIRVSGYSMLERTNFDLTLVVMTFDSIEAKLIYNADVFHRDTIRRLSEHFIRSLEEITRDPAVRLRDMDILSDTEKERLLVEFNRTTTDYPRDKTLVQLMEEQAASLPEKTALIFENSIMTYGELNRKANQLSRFLQEKGVKPGDIVGLLLERSFEMVVAIFGILKVGAAYLPLDHKFPMERICNIVKDAGLSLLLAQAGLIEKNEALAADAEILILEDVIAAMEDYPAENPAVYNTSADIAYVMYTSGSTGKPKGILTTHYNISRVVKKTNYIEINEDDVLLQLSNYAFDGSTFDIFGALLNGAKLVLARKETFLDISRLSQIIKERKVSVFFLTTALFNTLVDLEPDCLDGVRKVLFGGERVSVQHVRKALQIMGKDRIIHVYGPTETTVYATWYSVNHIDEDLGTIPIGKALSNTELYVLDNDMGLLPEGIPGELYIGGDGVAKGYLNRPDLTAERFVKNPFKPDKLIYKTGDLVRWLPGGDIEFVDRLDNQVKIRGFRIELGEIETALLTFDGIKEAVVMARQDRGGNRQLCAYLVTDREIGFKEIRDYLWGRLPDYMVPSQAIFLDQMPLTSNGKVDKKALLKYEGTVQLKEASMEPSSPMETELQSLWKEVLGVENIGINDDFFELGGHSLKATILASKIHKKLDVKVPLGEILKNPTIRELAGYMAGAGKTALDPIAPVAEQEAYELSSAQKRVYVQEQFEGIGTSYNMPVAMKMEGSLDRVRLDAALDEMIDRHEAFRTTFCILEGEIVQKIHKSVNFKMEYEEAAEGDLDRLVREFIRPFDLSTAPMLRVKLIRFSEVKYLLIMDMHHIISDGISLVVFIRELAALYEGKVLETRKIQYKDFAVWQEKFFKSDVFKKQESYWTEVFLGELPVLNMPLDYRRPEKRSFQGDSIRFGISREATAALNRLARNKNVTINALLLSVYSIMLGRYSGQHDIIIGSLVAGRTHPDVESVIGMFNNFLPLRIRLTEDSTFEKFLVESNKDILRAYENQDYPYERLVESLPVGIDPSRNPLFDTMLILHNQLEAIDNMKFDDLSLKNYEIDHNTSKLDFKLDIYNGNASGELLCVLEYNTALFRPETMQRMAGHFGQIIKEVVKNPAVSLKEIEMLPEGEKEQILYTFNNTQVDYPKNTTIVQLFQQQVERAPDRTAVIYDGNMLTYRQLNCKANQMARVLRKMGVGRDSIVGMLVERSLEMSIGILAILKAGGAYVPISPDYPSERIKYILEDSGANILLTQNTIEKLQWTINNEKSVELIDLNDQGLYVGDDSNPEEISLSTDLAYVIYTSGSTGKPKGVLIEHCSLINRLNWMQKLYPIGEEDTILQKTPYTFDVSVWELFWWSFTGARVCFLKPGEEKEPAAIVEVIEKNGVTTMHFVPSMLSTFLGFLEDDVDLDRLKSLRQVFSSGEALNLQQVNTFNHILNARNGTRLHNLYGPTEATVDVSYFDCSTRKDLEVIPIGKPIDNIQMYILDKYYCLQPIGVPGELHIAGDGLARGYLNRSELTTEKFIPNPFMPGQRMYKTGDLARWLPDGNIEYLGRMDNQVKVRGFRIELGEIEAELLKHADITEAVVTVRDDREGNKYLCAYQVSDRELTVAELRNHLSQNLPEYMIPSYFIRIEKIPLSSSGKADRKALPEPTVEINIGRQYEEPTNEAEEKLTVIWQEVLGVERVGINDNFFELGGHSLKAASLAIKIHKEFKVGITLGEIFQASTIKNVARFIEEAKEKTFTAIEKIDIREYHPVSSSQKRLFIINQLEGSNTTYNLPSIVMIEGKLEVERFKGAFQTLVRRHESLRTSFKLIGEDPVQMVHNDVDITIEYSQATEDQLKEIAQRFVRPFDLGKAPLLRVALVKISDEKHLLMFDVHHIIADGVSSVILVKEFARVYAGETLPELKIQYKDFAAWQNELNAGDEIEKKKQYWLDVFKGTVPVLNLPTDYPRPSVQSNEGDKLTFQLGSSMVDGLKKVAAARGATLYMALLAVYNTMLYRYTGQEDIVVGSPTAGRQHADVEDMIGMFVNTLALRSFPEGGKTFNRFLEEVRDNALKAHENQDYQFEKLVDALDLPRDISRNPMFDTMFVLQNMGIPQMELEGLKFLPYSVENKASKFDLTLEVVEDPDDTRINIEYCTKLFKKDTIQRLASHFVNIIKGVISNPEVRLSEVEMLSEEEKREILHTFNDTTAEYPKGSTIVQLFQEQVEKAPDRTAVIFESSYLTYHQLNSKANQLARLLRAKGIGRDSIVGIMVERSLEMSVGIMAIVKAGGAYIPISPDYPDERIKYMLEDSGTGILLTDARFKDKAGLSREILCLEDPELYTGDDSNLENINAPNDLAYVIYTSGSTGKPKGAMIEHQSLVNRLNWMQRKYSIGDGDTILQKTPYTFDVSVWEIFWWPFTGARACFLKPGGEKDPEAIVEAIEKNKVTTIHFVPSMLNVFLGYLENGIDLGRLKSLRQVFASGEALNLQQVSKFNRILKGRNGTTLHNLYGPTEATVDVSYFDCFTGEDFESIPIGKPIDNIRLYVLNQESGLQPVGVPGELHIAGDGLARGYLNRIELTSEKFVPNPFTPGQRMYKTGDLAKWLPDGNIEYLGRIDNQVKVRGFRIELGEVEAELLKHADIREAVVAAKDDGEGSKYLCAYMVSERDLTVSELRDHLSESLPDYMIPSYFVRIEAMPITPNGKVDRKALPEPEGSINTGRDYQAPTNEVEEKLVEIWKEVLGLEIIGIHDKFFELGGYSILLIKMHANVEELYPGRVKITDLFAYPTVAKLAEFILSAGPEKMKPLPIKDVELPQEYFDVEEKANKEVSFRLSLDSEVEKKMLALSVDTGTDVEDILLSVYAYLFSQITEMGQIPVQVAVEEVDVICALDIEMADIDKFADLVGLMNQTRKNTPEENIYRTKDLSGVILDRERSTVVPLLYRANAISTNFDILNFFDIALEVDKEDGKTVCLCRFNGKRLSKARMKEFVGLYLKLLELFME